MGKLAECAPGTGYKMDALFCKRVNGIPVSAADISLRVKQRTVKVACDEFVFGHGVTSKNAEYRGYNGKRQILDGICRFSAIGCEKRDFDAYVYYFAFSFAVFKDAISILLMLSARESKSS